MDRAAAGPLELALLYGGPPAAFDDCWGISASGDRHSVPGVSERQNDTGKQCTKAAFYGMCTDFF